jgi:hypothetical protein
VNKPGKPELPRPTGGFDYVIGKDAAAVQRLIEILKRRPKPPR